MLNRFIILKVFVSLLTTIYQNMKSVKESYQKEIAVRLPQKDLLYKIY